MGQTLRASMHILFRVGSDEPLSFTITSDALQAAIDFVEVCIQQTAYIGGRGKIDDDISLICSGKHFSFRGPKIVLATCVCIYICLVSKFLHYWLYATNEFSQ